jgi:hypothetical protein
MVPVEEFPHQQRTLAALKQVVFEFDPEQLEKTAVQQLLFDN